MRRARPDEAAFGTAREASLVSGRLGVVLGPVSARAGPVSGEGVCRCAVELYRLPVGASSGEKKEHYVNTLTKPGGIPLQTARQTVTVV